MKRLIITIVLVLVLVPLTVFSYDTIWRDRHVNIASHSIQTDNSSIITTGAGLFYGIVVRTDGTNDVTLNVYDAKSATGTRLTPANIVIDGATFQSGWSYSLDPAITYTSGIYVDVSVAGGGGCSYDVLYYTLP